MDDRRFDALTKALAAAKPSRREALRRLAGGALATVLGGIALEEASAQTVGTEAFNLVCKQEGAEFFCTEGTPAMKLPPANPLTRAAFAHGRREAGRCA